MDYARTMRILILFITLILLIPVSAEVYRTTDENGNVIFTDKPSPGAEEIEIDEVQTVSPPPVRDFRYTPPKKKGKSNYKKAEITTPKNDDVITGGTGNVSVSISLEPALQDTDRIVLYMDGEKQSDSSSTSFELSNLDRGTHTIKVDIINKGGKVLKSSSPVSFTVQRPSVLTRP